MGYSLSDLQNLWIGAGGDPSVAPEMAAIAAAESSYGTNLVGDGGTSFGLWQIHTPAWPQFDPTSLTNNAQYNAAAAVQVYNKQGLDAWSTWTNGAAQAILNASGGSPAPSTAASSSPAAVFAPSPIPATVTTGLAVLAAIVVLVVAISSGKSAA
jgi:hypothetical protein